MSNKEIMVAMAEVLEPVFRLAAVNNKSAWMVEYTPGVGVSIVPTKAKATATTIQRMRGRSIGFCVKFKDGTEIKEPSANQTFIKTLQKIGLQHIADLNINIRNYNLISDIERTEDKCQTKVDGWYIFTKLGNPDKKEILRKISDKLSLGLVIQDVEPLN